MSATTFDLAIAGMTCASCVARVETVLRRVPGVDQASVNLATETAHITGAGLTVPNLIAAVDQAGYTATPRQLTQPQTDRRAWLEFTAGALLSVPLLASMATPIPGALQFALATIVQFWLGARFYRAGLSALRHRAANMDLLVALGSTAAYALSTADLIRAAGPLYFEAGAVVITLIRLGKLLEARAKHQAVAAITSLATLCPAIAHLAGPPVTDIPTATLRIGDIVQLRPGERVPADGIITTGTGSLDEAHLTGESLPVPRAPGDTVLAGALNLDALLHIRVTAPPGASFLDRMAALIDTAQSSKPAIQKLADQIAAIFVPAVVVIALATFAAWFFLLHAPAATAIINAVSVLVIACPCALGLATPAAILAGTAAAARHGILLRDADTITRAAKIDLVIFDKTGTLTEGRPKLTGIQLLGAKSEPEVLAIAAALAAADTHPLGSALRQPNTAPAENFRALPGRGVTGRVAGGPYLLGSAALLAEAGAAVTQPATGTWSYLATAAGTPLAAFAFADTIRPDAAAALARLRAMHIATAMLSGDSAAATAPIAAALGITDHIAGATPAAKLAQIQTRRAAGAIIAMVGDGINDAAALAAADVGIAIGQAADIAIEAAGISLLRPKLMLVPDAIALARRIRATIHQGLFWAVIYNAAGIPLAACGRLNPMLAGAAMAASSVCVILNALRLRSKR